MKLPEWTLLLCSLALIAVTARVHANEADAIKDATILTNFGEQHANFNWYVQNDTVMGGRSSGKYIIDNMQLVFTGVTNTNGGGFSSIRTRPLRLDLSEYAGIQLSLKADGRRYTWHIQTDATWRGRRISYWADFNTYDNDWMTINIPFTSFQPQFRGYLLEGPVLDIANIKELGLYIYDKQNGAFKLQLDHVSAYTAE